MTVELISVYQANGDVKNGKDPDVILTLWNLLCERGDDVNISHKEVPSMRDHCDFVANRPYRDWYLIRNADNQIVGACYIPNRGRSAFRFLKPIGAGDLRRRRSGSLWSGVGAAAIGC
jgi:hypothetical protein